MDDKPFHILPCPPGTVLPKELESKMELVETLSNGLQVHKIDIPEGMQVPGPKSLSFHPQLIGAGNDQNDPQNLSIILYSDFTPPSSGKREDVMNALTNTGSFILISEDNPHLIKFKVKGKPAFIDVSDIIFLSISIDIVIFRTKMAILAFSASSEQYLINTPNKQE